VLVSQDPPKKISKPKTTPKVVKVQIDTTKVERYADTIYLNQSLAIDKLDSLIKEQKNKKN
jgi:hypothetical protein